MIITKDNIEKKRIDITDKTTLIFGDVHFPFENDNFFNYLKYMLKEFKPEVVLITGDLIDFNLINFHDKEMDIYNPYNEIEQIIEKTRELRYILESNGVKEVYMVLGNHDMLPFRQFNRNLLPYQFMKPFDELFNIKNWIISDRFFIKLNNLNGLMIHNISTNPINKMSRIGDFLIQGHYHTNQRLQFIENIDNKMKFILEPGCNVDEFSSVFNYQKNAINKGFGVIVNNYPFLINYHFIKNNKGD